MNELVVIIWFFKYKLLICLKQGLYRDKTTLVKFMCNFYVYLNICSFSVYFPSGVTIWIKYKPLRIVEMSIIS